VGDGALWVHAAGTAVRIDPVTNPAAGRPLRVPADAEAIAVADGALWVASVGPGDLGTVGEDRVTRIDLVTGRPVATITVGRAPLDLAVTRGLSGCPTWAAAATAWRGSTRGPTEPSTQGYTPPR
jgi:hypothetical protein